MISKKCIYALKAVLVLSRNHGRAPITIHHIAEEEDIPPRFLEAILRDLKQTGITDSIRGKDGGYLLTRAPHQISMGQVVRAVEGPWFPGSEEDKPDVFQSVWAESETALRNVLDQKNFQTLISEQDKLRGGGTLNYSI